MNIHPKLIKKLKLKFKPISIFANYCLSISNYNLFIREIRDKTCAKLQNFISIN